MNLIRRIALRGMSIFGSGEKLDHRRYVGGLWNEMGKLQFDFLLSEGLLPHHVLLDVACGSLRAGRLLVPYLDEGRYLGIDRSAELIAAGVDRELGPDLVLRKQPRLLVSESFEFERFGVAPDYALAQSLFTHLTPPLIDLCMGRLRPVIAPGGVFLATFFEEVPGTGPNPEEPNDHKRFYYSRARMEQFGADNGWAMEYVGNWGHPRGQIMVRYRPA